MTLRLARARWPAFTLIEVLAVISIIGMLIAIALPTLHDAFSTAKVSAQAQSSRQTFMALMQYTGDFGGAYPYYGTPGDPYGPLRFGDTVLTDTSYFQTQRHYWASALVPAYIENRTMVEPPEYTELLLDRGREDLILSTTTISSTVHADPAYFSLDANGLPWDATQLRATRTSEVLFPSEKIILIAWWGAMATPMEYRLGAEYGYPAIFGDGSTVTFSEAQIIQMPSIERPLAGNIPVHTTIDGLRGRERP